MNKLENILAALTPKRWPVLSRLAAVSATLTLIILVVFAVIVGRLTSNRLQNDFNDELRATGDRLALELQFTGKATHVSPDPGQVAAGATAVRVVDPTGNEVRGGAPVGAPHLRPPRNVDRLSHLGSLRGFTASTS